MPPGVPVEPNRQYNVAAADSLAVLNRVVLRNAASIIARRKLPLPLALSPKSRSFFPVSLSPNIVASPRLRLRLPWPSPKFTSRNQTSKTPHRALPAT